MTPSKPSDDVVPTRTPPTDDPIARYRARREAAAAERDGLERRARRVSNLRLLTFVAGIAALVWAELRPEAGAVALLTFAAAVVAFLGLVVTHARLTQRARRAGAMARVNEDALARLRRDWDALPPVPDVAPPGHPYARDLDVTGPASLARLLDTTGTAAGRQRLHGWLLEPSPASAARRRRTAVEELVGLLDFRQDIQVQGRLAAETDPEALERFLAWAEDEPWLLRRPLLLWAARLIPAATLVLAVLHVRGDVAGPWWIAPLGLGTALAATAGKRVHRSFARASLGDASLRQYAGLVERIHDQPFESEPLRAVREALAGDMDARRELERLAWLTELAELRHGGLFYVLVNVPTLWDFHVLRALEGWQRRAGRHARRWTDAVAEIDALAALSAPPADEPGWTFPELRDRGDRVTARGLAHPLLASGDRVANDVEVGPPGSFLMVTGSNMSGKSTLLRAIGANAVLARAGGPVCAASLALPPLDVRTSMRVEDSLERGVSLFMAELQRLKQVVDAADAAGGAGSAAAAEGGEPDGAPAPGGAPGRSGAGEGGRLVLYLLDEILHGTNSAERQVAVREVLGHLLRRPAIGAISTHDLELATAEPLASAVVPVHFRETVHPEGHEPAMSFDYRLRPGIATSTNALKLVRLVGLA